MNQLEDFNQISTFIFDVDGVMTDGYVLVQEDGSLLRTMSIRDGMALKKAATSDYLDVCVITGGRSEGVKRRLEGLGIMDIYIGVENKLERFEEYIRDNELNPQEILYMGDDLPDLEVMQRVGLPCCPQDAAKEIQEISTYISPFKGGHGCVRDVIEKVMRIHNLW